MIDVETISVVLASLSVVGGVIYYVQAIRDQVKTRNTDLVMRLYATYSSSEFQDAWIKVRKTVEKRNIADIDDFDEKVGVKEFNQVCLFFEGVGILLRRGIVDATIIEDLFGGAVERAWGYVKNAVYQGRQEMNDSSIYFYFEYLYNEMKKREQKLQA